MKRSVASRVAVAPQKHERRLKPIVVHGAEPPGELLRLRELQKWIKISRDRLESLEAAGKLTPLRKNWNAKALYRKWQFYDLIPPRAARHANNVNRMPTTYFVRRLDAVAWLGVTIAEFESWTAEKLIHPTRIRGDRAKAHFLVSEIEQSILGRPATKPFTLKNLLYDADKYCRISEGKKRRDIGNDTETR